MVRTKATQCYSRLGGRHKRILGVEATFYRFKTRFVSSLPSVKGFIFEIQRVQELEYKKKFTNNVKSNGSHAPYICFRVFLHFNFLSF